MPLGTFYVRSAGVWTAPAAGGRPDSTAPALVRYPEVEGLSISGRPIGGVGSPWCELGRRTIKAASISWYVNHMEESKTTNSVDVCLFDPRRNAWCTYTGIMHLPTVISSRAGASVRYVGFRVLFSELVFTGIDTQL